MPQLAEPAGADPGPGNVGSASRAARADLTDPSAPAAGKVRPADRAASPGDVDGSWMPDALEDWALDVPDKRIDVLARHLKTTGLDGTLDQLRARMRTGTAICMR